MIYQDFLYGEQLYERQGIIGYRIIPVTIPLALGMATIINIAWTADTPPNTRIIVEVSSDNGITWQRLYNSINSSIIFNTQIAGNQNLLIKTTLETTSLITIPRLHSLTVNVSQIATLYRLAYDVLSDAVVQPSEYWIDPELLEYAIPFAWLKRGSHRDALEQIIKTCTGRGYVERNNVIRIEGPSYQKTDPSEITINNDDYFHKNLFSKEHQQANVIEVYANPLLPTATIEEVYRSSKPEKILAGETKTITAFYTAFYTQNPVIDCIATLENASSGTTIQNALYYAWGAVVTVVSTEDGSFTLVIDGKPLKVKGRTRAEAKDSISMDNNGVYSYKYPSNHLVQTGDMAQKIADTLLQKYKDPSDNLELIYRGNPALELDDTITLNPREYLIKTHELKFDGKLEGKIIG
ncbi:MAG TPA: hypothetical protein VHY08_20765 [Bacillota bacterium]|nr:hypothetical protein [Bacillota bacterium]